MLLNVVASLDLAAIADDEPWARAWCEPEGMIKKTSAGRRLRDVTVAPPHPFDADTALEPTGDGHWRASPPEHWFVARGPNGGYLAAVAARAAEAAAGRLRWPCACCRFADAPGIEAAGAYSRR